MHYYFDNLDFMYAIEIQKVLDTLFVVIELLSQYQFTRSPFTLLLILHGLWHFVQCIVKGPWAKIARRYRTLLPLAGVGNTQPGEEKTLCHIFPKTYFANSDFGPYIVLYCGALGGKKRQNYSYLPYSLVSLFVKCDCTLQESYDPSFLSLIQ